MNAFRNFRGHKMLDLISVLVPVIFKGFEDFYNVLAVKKLKSRWFQTLAKVKSRCLSKRSARPDTSIVVIIEV